MTVAVIDSGVANLESVMGALRRLNADCITTSDASVISKANHVILPGVGAAVSAMAQLKAKNLIDCIRALSQPVLGICLGMQLLFEHSGEGSAVDCLSVIKGTVTRLPSKADQPVPHMGWNTLSFKKQNHALLRDVPADGYVYFVHSFAAPVSDATVASTDYSASFSAMVAQNNFMGCQFHPERSGTVGSQILKNFLSM
jgi:glutamine amidotransferase